MIEIETPRLFIRKLQENDRQDTFTTRMCEAGVNIKVMQDTLGHADISTTLNIYADVTKELKKDEFIGLDSYFTAKSRNQASP